MARRGNRTPSRQELLADCEVLRAKLAAMEETLRARTEGTERRQALETLPEAQRTVRRERDILQAVMDGAKNSPLVYLDRDFNFVRVNEAYARTCGYRPEEMIGKNHFALYPHAENEAIFARVRDTGEPVEYHDKPFEFPDQPERGVTYWNWTLIPVKAPDGRVEGLVFSLHETTACKRAEEALRTANEDLRVRTEQLDGLNDRLQAKQKELEDINEYLRRQTEVLQESEEHYRSLFDNMLNGLAVCRMLFVENRPVDFTYLQVNRAFERLTGLKNVTGKNVSEVIPRLRETNPELFEIYGRVARTGRPERVETYVEPLDMWFLISVYSPQKEHFVAVFDVITEQKRAEEALREWNATLEEKVAQQTAQLRYRTRQLQKLTLELSEAEERERRRVAIILHEDLQQRIAGARFHLSLVRDRAGEEQQQAVMDKVDALLKDVIEQSRRLSRDLSPAVLHMNDLREVLQWLADRMQEQFGLRVRVTVVGNMMLYSEALAIFLFRSVQEMLFNVVRHARVREAVIRVRKIRRCVGLSVSDRGRGFDPLTLRETSGIGLFGIRERTELLGGRMKIQSVRGQGSTFRILVPDAPEAEGEKKMTTEEIAGLGTASAAAPSSARGALRVLLVDDHEIVRQGVAALLQDAADIKVVGEASDGREAIDMANDLHPDVVVMDVSMPLMSGDQATQQIKAYLPQARVIALSMYDEADKKERMYQAGAEDYVLKTASAEELLAAIRGRKADE